MTEFSFWCCFRGKMLALRPFWSESPNLMRGRRMLHLLKSVKGQLFSQLSLTKAAKDELKADLLGLSAHDPGPEAVIAGCTKWLCLAQDKSASHDGGVARDFSLLTGWS